MSVAKMRVYRGDKEGGKEMEYEVPLEEGMVVLDALHFIQANYDGDLAVRWNCKAIRCFSWRRSGRFRIVLNSGCPTNRICNNLVRGVSKLESSRTSSST